MAGRGGSVAFTTNLDPSKLARPASESELPTLAELKGEVGRRTYSQIFDEPELERWLTYSASEEDLRQIADKGGIYVVSNGDEPEAMASFVIEEDSTAVIKNFYCRRQGEGLGTHLLAALTEHARSEGLLTLAADVFPDNRKAIGFFSARGFRLSDARSHNYLGREMWRLTRPVSQLPHWS